MHKFVHIVARWPFWIVAQSLVVARCEFCAQRGAGVAAMWPFWIVTWSFAVAKLQRVANSPSATMQLQAGKLLP